MYDTHWPRPGPAMAAVAAVLGVVAGALLGLSSAGSEPRAQASAAPETRAVATTTTLPATFHTVILGSFRDRAGANQRLRKLRDQGVGDAGLLDQEQYDIGTRWALYSGHFATREQAEAHGQELGGLGITERYWKHVTRTT
jgi:cell division septation protein DedD